MPAGLDNSDRDYFQAQVAHDAGTFIGDIVQAKLGGFRFFVTKANNRRAERVLITRQPLGESRADDADRPPDRAPAAPPAAT